MTLVYWEIGAELSGEKRHPCEVIRSLGIDYRASQSNSIADNWFFFDATNVPESLPDYITVKSR